MEGDANDDVTAHASLRDNIEANPYWHFVVSELYATAAAGVVYICARFVAFAIQFADKHMPLDEPGPLHFVEQVLAWGGAIATASVFILTSFYQLVVLLKRLYKGVAK